ncbi:MAG: hypothetical protein ABL874_11200 [Sphingopyxis sp.]
MTLNITPARFAMLLWLLVAIVATTLNFHNIVALNPNDPDDALRLVQVRDLLGGQGWWDSVQHRINPTGGGGLMHWSRIVDMPLALGIAALTPLLGQSMAEMMVMALWPLVLLLPLFALVVRTAEALGGRRLGLVAPLLLICNLTILFQFAPLRIDHHGWQIVLAGGLLLLALLPASRSCGLLAGLVAAAYLAISLEGLPAVTVVAAIMAVEWWWSGGAEARARLIAYLATLSLAAAALQWLTRGPAGLYSTWCDALSLPYLGALAVAALVVAIGASVADRTANNRAARFAVLGVGGLVTAAVLVMIEPACARGPFVTLDPFIRDHWFNHVREALPPWAVLDFMTGFALAPTLVGLIGTACALRASSGEDRRRWLVVATALVAMAVVSLFIMRASSAAQLYAIPGTGFALIAAWRWARAIGPAVLRIAATVGSMAIVPLAAGSLGGLATNALAGRDAPGAAAEQTAPPCVNPPGVVGLNATPPALLFAPIDIGPFILQRTPHSVVATGHHRNAAAIERVFKAFGGSAEDARAAIAASGATMIVVCTDSPEYDNFRSMGVGNFADQLAESRAPEWLERAEMPRGSRLSVWRVGR